MAAAFPRQYVHVSMSISDCQKIFELNKYTPEQLVDAVFSSSRSRRLSKQQFAQAFQAAFERNVAPENTSKVDDAINRVYEVCAQGAPEVTVDQFGKGVGVFTTKREGVANLRDLFFYIDKDFKSVIQADDIQAFLREASAKGVNVNISNHVAELQKEVPNISYWSLYVLRNHPAIQGFSEIYRELQSKRRVSQPQSTPNLDSKQNYSERPQNLNLSPSDNGGLNSARNHDNEIVISKNADREKERAVKAGAPGQGDQNGLPRSPNKNLTPNQDNFAGRDDGRTPTAIGKQERESDKHQLFSGSEGILGRKIPKLKSFDEFLDVGARLRLNQITAKQFLLMSRSYFAATQRVQGDFTLHEWIRLGVDMFMTPADDYYEFTNAVIQLFQFMDLNDNGILEQSECFQGLIYLFKGTEEEKIAAAFLLLDRQNHGFLEFNDLNSLIFSTIRLNEHKGRCNHEHDETKLREIAYATTYSIFEMIDTDHDAKITLEEFLLWYKSSYQGDINPEHLKAAKAVKEIKLQLHQQRLDEQEKSKKAHPGATHDAFKKKIEDSGADIYVINEIRDKIPFDKINVQLALEALKTEVPNGVCDYKQFTQYITTLLRTYNLPGEKSINEVAKKLFNALDTNKNGLLEISEIATGMGLLCGGTSVEKLKAGFDLFDLNHDHVHTVTECSNFMTAFFKVIQCDSPNLEIYNADPAKLGQALAITAFKENNIPLDGFIDFFTLNKWVQTLGK